MRSNPIMAVISRVSPNKINALKAPEKAIKFVLGAIFPAPNTSIAL